jgi:hypothetical protein
MNLRSTLILSAALLFLSAPAWGDSFKVKGLPSVNAVYFHDGTLKSHSNIKFLGGFKSEDSKHFGFFNIKKGTFKLHVPSGSVDENPKDDNNQNPGDPVSTPEPAVLSLLLIGFLGLGAFALRRTPTTVAVR